MTKLLSAKHKIDRRLGENIWDRPKSPVNKREYGPGQHGLPRRRPGFMAANSMRQRPRPWPKLCSRQ